MFTSRRIIQEAKKMLKKEEQARSKLEDILCQFMDIFKESDPVKFKQKQEKMRDKLGKFLKKKGKKTVNLGMTLDEYDVLIFFMNYAPPSCADYSGTDEYDKMDPTNGCISLLVQGFVTVLLREGGYDHKAPKTGAKGITFVDRVPFATDTKNDYKKEVNKFCRALKVNQHAMHLMTVLMLASKVHYASLLGKRATIVGEGAPVRDSIFQLEETILTE